MYEQEVIRDDKWEVTRTRDEKGLSGLEFKATFEGYFIDIKIKEKTHRTKVALSLYMQAPNGFRIYPLPGKKTTIIEEDRDTVFTNATRYTYPIRKAIENSPLDFLKNLYTRNFN